MAELEQQAGSPAFAGVTVEGNDFASLLNKEFKPKTADAKSAVAVAVKTLAEQALSATTLVSDDAIKTIQAIITQLISMHNHIFLWRNISEWRTTPCETAAPDGSSMCANSGAGSRTYFATRNAVRRPGTPAMKNAARQP